MHAFNSSTRETKWGGSLWVWGRAETDKRGRTCWLQITGLTYENRPQDSLRAKGSTVPSACELSSSLAPSTLGHRCTVPSGSLRGLGSCPSSQGQGRNCRLPTAHLSTFGRTETSRDCWPKQRKEKQKLTLPRAVLLHTCAVLHAYETEALKVFSMDGMR